jgi:hypothetical protein
LSVVVLVIVLVVTPFVGGVPVDTVQPVETVLVLATSVLEVPVEWSAGVKVIVPVM